MEGEDYGCGAIGEHAKRSGEEDEMHIPRCREQCLDTEFFFEFGKHVVFECFVVEGFQIIYVAWPGRECHCSLVGFRDLRVTM